MPGHALVLQVASDEVEAQQWLVSDAGVEIGRGREAGVCLRHPSVSRWHASLSMTAQGFELRDLGSTNGTFVNGRRLDQPRLVKDGDRLTFGDVSLVVELDGARATDPPAIRTLMVELDEVLAPTPLAIDLTPVTPTARRDVTMPDGLPVLTSALPAQRPRVEPCPSEPPNASTLAQTIDQANALATALRAFSADLQVGVWLFEHAGGRLAARNAIEQIRAAEAQPLEQPPGPWASLAEALPTLRVLLEAQLILVDLLQPSPGDLTHDDHLQADTAHQ
jgi:predicted component of type VI protein secretion system